MGTWGTSLFSNDTTCDVRATYLQYYLQSNDMKEAFKRTYDEYKELIDTDEEALFWFSLAQTQWEFGEIMSDVRNKTKEIVESYDIVFGEDLDSIENWRSIIIEMKRILSSSLTVPKKPKKIKRFVKNPWNIGDVYAYRFHTNIAEKEGLLGKYILFHKVGDVEYYDGVVFSVVQVYNMAFDQIPRIEDINVGKILPLVAPPNIDGTPKNIAEYVPSFTWYLQATMIYEQASDYPIDYLFFVFYLNVCPKEFSGNGMTDFVLEKDGMEEWLCYYYSNWRKELPIS